MRLAEYRGCLGAGVSRRKHDLREVGPERQRLAEADRRPTTERDETVSVMGNELRHNAFGNIYGSVHDSISRKVDTKPVQCVHKSRRTCRCVMWIGENESPLATQSEQFVGSPWECAEPENDTRWQRRIFKRLHVACPELRVPVLRGRIPRSSPRALQTSEPCRLRLTENFRRSGCNAEPCSERSGSDRSCGPPPRPERRRPWRRSRRTVLRRISCRAA